MRENFTACGRGADRPQGDRVPLAGACRPGPLGRDVHPRAVERRNQLRIARFQSPVARKIDRMGSNGRRPRPDADLAAADRQRAATRFLLVCDRDAPAGLPGDRLDPGRRAARRRPAAGRVRLSARAHRDHLRLPGARHARRDDARPLHHLVAGAGLALPRVAGGLDERHASASTSSASPPPSSLIALLSTMGKPFFSVLLPLAVRADGARRVSTRSAARKTLFHAAGWCGLALAALAMYGGAALGLEDAGRASCCRCSGAATPTARSPATRHSSSGSSTSPASGSSSS